MPHPALEEILRGAASVADHLAGCASCRALAALARAPTEPPAGASTFPEEPVDRDRYLDWRPLGEGGGGMGRTFQAFDRRLGRDVVIKVPLEDPAHGFDLGARFEREALLTARLQHPAIVSVYEAGRFPGGEPFYAMPLVRGAPLSDEIDRRATLEERLGLLQSVTTACEAIAYAHEQGIVHRDVKPANILIGSFGETVVIDWGLAIDIRAARQHDRAPVPAVGDGLTQLGIGTARYMPPEQALGAAPDPRMDVYALGATLYHTLAGRPPFANLDPDEARRQLLEDAVPPLATVAPDAPPALCDIVARAMSRDPAGRFDTANALAAELRRFQTGQLVQSRRYSPGEIVRHFARRYRAPLVVAAVATALLVTGGLASMVQITGARRVASSAQRRAEDNEHASQQALRRARGVSASRLALSPTHRLDALALAIDAVAPDRAAGRAPEHDALQGLYDALGTGAIAVALETTTTEIRRMAFSADGKVLATLSPRDHAVHLWDGHTGRHLGIAAAGGAQFSVRELAFSPDGASLLTWGDAPPQAQLWPVHAGRALTLPVDDAIAGAGFLPDGTIAVAGRAVVLLGGDGHELRHVDLPAPASALAVGAARIAVGTAAGDVVVLDGAGELRSTLHVPPVVKLALSPDGARLAVLGAASLELHDLADPAATVTRVALSEPPGPRAALAFAGRQVVVSDPARGSLVVDGATSRATTVPQALLAPAGAWTGGAGHLSRIDLETLAPVQTIDGPPGVALAALATSPDGRIAAASERATWLVDARGEATGHTSEVAALAAVGPALVSAGLDGRLVAWDERGHATDTTSIGAEALVMLAAGPRLFIGAADGTLTTIEVVRGRFGAPATLAPAGAPIATLAVAPDGRYVVAARGDGAMFAVPATGSGAAVPWQAPGGSAATAIALSRDGAWVATGHLDGTLRAWRTAAAPGDAPSATIAGQTVLHARDSGGRARYTLAFDAANRLLASRFGDDCAAFTVPALEPRPSREGRLVAVSADGARVATFTAPGELLLFRGDELTARIPSSARPVTAARFSSDGTMLVTGDADGVVRVVDVRRAEAGASDAAFELPSAGDGVVSALAISRDNASVIAGHASGALRSHAIAADLALQRACRTLAYFDRANPACATVP